MHKRPQRRTRSRSKGYKLKLAPQLAHLRTVKGWKTKHLRYKYGKLYEQHHAVDLPHDEDLTEHEKADLRQERLDAIESAHAVPEKLLEEAARDLRRARREGREDPKMAEFIAKARAVRERELRAKRADLDPEANEYVANKYDRYGEMLTGVYSQINPRPGPQKSDRSPAITGDNARRKLKFAFNQVDPVTGKGRDYVSDAEIEQLVSEIQISHHGYTANERQVAANHAKTRAARLAQKVQREIDRRAMQTQAMSIEQQARREAGLTPGQPFGGTPESFITGAVEGEVGSRKGARRKTRKGADGDYQSWMRHYTTEAGSIRPEGIAYANPHFLKNLHHRATGRKQMGLDDLEASIKELEAKKRRTKGENSLLRDLRKEHTRARARYDALAQEYYRRVATGKHIELTGIKTTPRERRLGGTLEAPTVEDIYRYYGHEDTNPEPGSVAKHHGKLVAQARFMKEQQKRRLKALKTGDLVHGWGDDRRTASDMDEALFSLSPNKKWKYKLNRSPSDIERNPEKDRRYVKELDYWDTKTKFHVGKRDRWGHLQPGEWDEIHEEHLQPKFKNTVNVTLGKREAKLSNEQKNDKTVEKHIFVPVAGISERSTKVIQGKQTVERIREANRKAGRPLDEGVDSGKWTQNLVQLQGEDGTPRWYPATEADLQLRRKSGQPERGAQAPSQAARTETERYDKDVHVHYVPEREMHLAKKERDRLSFKVPAVKIGNRELLGERLATFGIHEATDRSKVLNHAIFGYSRAQERINRDIESRQAAANETARVGKGAEHLLSEAGKERFDAMVKLQAEKTGAPEAKVRKQLESRFKSLAAAGVIATGYSARKQIIKGYGPQWLNRHIDSIRKDSPKLDHWLTKHNAKFFTVNEAYARPAGEKAANFWWMVRHPLSDPDGETLGVEWGRWRHRDFWIDETTRRHRVLERQTNKLDRVVRTQEWFEKNAYTDNWFKRQIVKRRDHLKNSKDYADFLKKGGLLDEAEGVAQKIRDESADAGLALHSSNLLAKIEHLRKRGHNSDAMQKRVSEWTGSLALDVPKGKRLVESVTDGPVGSRFAHLPHAKLGEAQHIIANNTAAQNIARYAADHRTFLIGAGVVGLAVGAHYARHKYVESKKRPEDRIAYYNKILPPAFTVKLPHIRGTGYINWANNPVTRELGVAGKKFPIPVQYGLSLHDHRIALRPMDRGYPANAPIIGGLRFRGPAPGGSLYHSVLENPDSKYNRKRSFTSTHSQVILGGKALPVYAQIGDRKKIQLSRTNPNRLTQGDRENLVWAYKGTAEEAGLKNFYQHDQKLQDMLEDPDEANRIARKKGTQEAKQFADELAALRRGRQAEKAPLDGDEDAMQETREERAFLRGMGADGLEVGVSAQRGDQDFKDKTKRWESKGIHWR